MRNYLFLFITACISIFSGFFGNGQAVAGQIQPGPGLSLKTPAGLQGGWQEARSGIRAATPPSVVQALNCVDADPGELKAVGWLMEGDTMQGAYCVSYRGRGMRKALGIVKTAQGKEREQAADKFMDTMAGVIKAGYDKRGIRIEAMNAELIEAGSDLVLVMDGILKGPAGEYTRSETVYLHGDAMLVISTVHGKTAPQAVVDQLEAIPVSVLWK